MKIGTYKGVEPPQFFWDPQELFDRANAHQHHVKAAADMIHVWDSGALDNDRDASDYLRAAQVHATLALALRPK